jgi:hypothetical protein
MRKLIKQADPRVVEEWKWMGTPVWSHVSGHHGRLRSRPVPGSAASGDANSPQ